MEQNNDKPLFSLSLDAQSKTFLTETAKWGKFLAIIGFVVCVLIIAVGIFFATQTSQLDKAFGEYGGSSSLSSLGPAMAVVYIIIAVIYFFPCLYLFKFSNHMNAAIASDDQANLIVAFQNLKSMFKFVGIFTIVLISIWLLSLAVGLTAGG